jgi:hypothetical protein
VPEDEGVANKRNSEAENLPPDISTQLYLNGVQKLHHELSISNLLVTARRVEWLYKLFVKDSLKELEKFSSHHVVVDDQELI